MKLLCKFLAPVPYVFIITGEQVGGLILLVRPTKNEVEVGEMA